MVSRGDEAGYGESLAQSCRAPEQELSGRVDLATVLAGSQQDDEAHVAEEGEDWTHHVSHNYDISREVAEDQLQDSQDRGGDSEKELDHDPGRPGHLPGLAGEAVVDVEWRGDQEDDHRYVDQHGGEEAFRELGVRCVPGEVCVPQLGPAELHPLDLFT